MTGQCITCNKKCFGTFIWKIGWFSWVDIREDENFIYRSMVSNNKVEYRNRNIYRFIYDIKVFCNESRICWFLLGCLWYDSKWRTVRDIPKRIMEVINKKTQFNKICLVNKSQLLFNDTTLIYPCLVLVLCFNKYLK